MKIFISADIEGVAGVVSPSQAQPGNNEYERARRLMTDEVSAAVAGAFDAGATSVLVNDGHGPQTNLLPDLLDPRAELLLGRPKHGGMCAGLDASCDAVFFTGYHSGAGQHGVLSHTINGFAFAAIRLNGTDCAEATLYGAYAASHGVPIALLTGDDQLMAQSAAAFPGAHTVVVKHAIGHRAARALSPQRACAAIRDGAAAALRNLETCRPAPIAVAYRLELDLTTVGIADLAAIIPVAERVGPRTVGFAATNISDVLGWINTVSVLAVSLR